MFKLIKLIFLITIIAAIFLYFFDKKTSFSSKKEKDFKTFSTEEELWNYIKFKRYYDLKEDWGIGEIGEPWDASGIGDLKMRISVKWPDVKCMGKSVKIDFDNYFTEIQEAFEKNPGNVNAYELYDAENSSNNNNALPSNAGLNNPSLDELSQYRLPPDTAYVSTPSSASNYIKLPDTTYLANSTSNSEMSKKGELAEEKSVSNANLSAIPLKPFFPKLKDNEVVYYVGDYSNPSSFWQSAIVRQGSLNRFPSIQASKQPTYYGGIDQLKKDILAHLNIYYPYSKLYEVQSYDIVIDETGRIINLITDDEDFNDKVKKTFGSFQKSFSPAISNGKAVKVTFTVNLYNH